MKLGCKGWGGGGVKGGGSRFKFTASKARGGECNKLKTSASREKAGGHKQQHFALPYVFHDAYYLFLQARSRGGGRYPCVSPEPEAGSNLSNRLTYIFRIQMFCQSTICHIFVDIL